LINNNLGLRLVKNLLKIQLKKFLIGSLKVSPRIIRPGIIKNKKKKKPRIN
jgi:hypothetical protein